MGFKKCPRCELNYILDTESLCKVCKREIKGEDRSEEIELCTICNERPAMHGKDICLVCYKEMEENGELPPDDDDARPEEEDSQEIDSIEDPDDLIDDEPDDIPEVELEEIENDLSLDEMGEEEEAMDDDEDEDDPYKE